MYDDIIPDSEPEREDQRRHLEEGRRVKRTRKRQAAELTKSASLVLSSSPEPDLRLPSTLSRKSPPKQSDAKSVISISDDSSSEADLVPNFSSAVAPPNATQATDPEPGPSRLPPPRKDSTPASNASSSELASGDRSLSSSDLSRFSYQPPQSLRDLIKKRGELEAQRIAEFGPPEPLRKSKATRPAAHRFTADFTDDDLSRVLKCVSCGDRWTVRKGATAKMRHIQSCAKKHAISDEIIKRLIRAELEAPEEPKPRQKPKPSTVTNTLFEDALGDTGKTKGKRKQVQQNSTLHDPAENREAILAKARSLLKEQEIRDISQDEGLVDLLSKSDSTMDRIQMFDFGPPSATQEFGRSKLGQQTSSAMLSVLSDENPKMSTTSKLADTANTRRRFDVLTGEPIDSGSPISIQSSIDIPLGRLSLGPPGCQEGDVQSGHGAAASQHNDSAILHYNQRDEDLVWDNDDWIFDDAVLHFDPDERGQPILRKPSQPLDTLVRTGTPSANINPVPATPQDPVAQGRERKIVKPRSRKKKVDVQPNDPTQLTEVDEAELKSRMVNAIREDGELYHRILRYDPIPLQDFVALATKMDLPIRGLQSRITKFLDDQAIHFQAPASGSRR